MVGGGEADITPARRADDGAIAQARLGQAAAPVAAEGTRDADLAAARAAYEALLEDIERVLRGGVDLSALTLSRFFSGHIWMLPAALAALIGVHLYLIIKHGESHFPKKDE